MMLLFLLRQDVVDGHVVVDEGECLSNPDATVGTTRRKQKHFTVLGAQRVRSR